MQRLSQSPTDPDFVQNPYPFYEKARAAGDFVVWEDYKMPCATTARAANAVLKDKRLGRAPPPGKGPVSTPHTRAFYDIEDHSMLELEPPVHTRLRGLVLRAFTSRRIAALGPDIDALSRELALNLPEGPFDLIPAYANRIPVIIISRLLGVPEDMADQLLAWSNAMVGMYQAGRTHEMEVAAGKASAEFTDFMRRYIDERRKKPGDDLITHLIDAEENGERLSTDELISTCILLLNAGHEATVHTLGNGIKAILETGLDPAWITPENAPRLVEEILRFDPPLHMFTRWVYEPVEILGHRFEAGTEVSALLGSVGRDNGPDSDRFDPKRTGAQHLSFGIGIHFCVGAPLARLEMASALKHLFEVHPNLKLHEPPKYADVYHFHGLKNLMVRT